MLIKLISDTHFEFFKDPELFRNASEDVLVIAGDLAVGNSVIPALEEFSKLYPHVVYVLGNHEAYGQDLNSLCESIQKHFQGTNVHFLNPGHVRIKDVTFIGGTLWTNFRKDMWSKQICSSRINDFRLIKGFNSDICTELHEQHFKYIQEAYRLEGKKVIVSHFLPATECIDKQYQGPDLINHYFANDYGSYISTLSNTTWLFGHTHSRADLVLGTTRLIANPYGYNKNRDYKAVIIPQ